MKKSKEQDLIVQEIMQAHVRELSKKIDTTIGEYVHKSLLQIDELNSGAQAAVAINACICSLVFMIGSMSKPGCFKDAFNETLETMQKLRDSYAREFIKNDE